MLPVGGDNLIPNSDTNSTFSSDDGEDDDLFRSKHYQFLSKWNPLEDDATTMQPIFIEKIDDQLIEAETLSIHELERCIKVVLQSNETIIAENELIFSYLSDVDPSLLENMDDILESASAAILKAERTAQLGAMAAISEQGSIVERESSSASPRSTFGGLTATIPCSKVLGFTAPDKGPRVQAPQKTEIAQREIDKLRSAFYDETNHCEKLFFSIKCEQEELDIRLKELINLKKTFLENMSKEWVDKKTLNIAGEKVLSYFENKHNLDLCMIKALKTKLKNSKIQIEAITTKVRDIGRGLRSVDYEQLHIFYQNVHKKTAVTVDKLSEYKKANTAYLKIYIALHAISLDVFKEREQLKNRANHLERDTAKLLENGDKALENIVKTRKRMNAIQSKMSKFTAPDAMSYIQHKHDLQELKKALKTLKRKNKSWFSKHGELGVRPHVPQSEQPKKVARIPRKIAIWKPADSVVRPQQSLKLNFAPKNEA